MFVGTRGLKAAAAALVFSLVAMLGGCSLDAQKGKVKYLESGKRYLKAGKYQEAAIQFRNAAKLDPRFVEAYYELAQADAAQHDWSAAYSSLNRVIELDPSRLDARMDRGRLYLATRDFDKAEREANFILTQDSKNVGAYQLLGSALIGKKEPEQALAAFSRVTEFQPNNDSNYVNMALVEITLRRLPDAERHFRRAVQINPKSVQASLNLAKMLLSEGKAADADEILDRLRNQIPKSAEAAIAIGDYYLATHDSGKALAEYRRGLSVSSNNLDIEKRMEDAYLVSNQIEPAAQIDAQLMKLAPKDGLVRLNHGRLLMAQGNLQDAERELREAVKDAADSSQAHYFLAVCYWRKGSVGSANSEFQEALRISPGLPIVLQNLAQLNLSQGNASVAQIYGQELVQKYPTDASDRLMLGAIYLREGQLHPAEEQFLAARRLAPNQAAVHLNLGQLYSAEKQWSEAEKELETAIQLDPLNAAVLGPYAAFLAAHQGSNKGIARAQQFVNANPTNAQGHLILGALQFEANNNSSAKAEFERAIQLDPKNSQAYLQMGRVYEVESRADLAIGQYQKALDLQPNAPLGIMIGNLYLHQGALEIARQYFQRALDADPDNAIAMANMAWVDALEGKNLNVALGMAQRAKSLMPGLPAITDTLAWVMYKRGNYAEAIPLLQECVQKSPDSAEFRYHLGMTFVATGEREKGKEQLEAALRMKLDNSEAQQARQVLARTN